MGNPIDGQSVDVMDARAEFGLELGDYAGRHGRASRVAFGHRGEVRMGRGGVVHERNVGRNGGDAKRGAPTFHHAESSRRIEAVIQHQRRASEITQRKLRHQASDVEQRRGA
jgi:hypothetical protein